MPSVGLGIYLLVALFVVALAIYREINEEE